MEVKRSSVRVAFAAALFGIASLGIAHSAASASPASLGGPPVNECVANSDGKIDFRGQLGHAGGLSFVQIMPDSEGAEFYADNLARNVGGTSGGTASAPRSLDELQAFQSRASKVPSALAAAAVAMLVHGAFSCRGFEPGRYIFLAQVQGGGVVAGDGGSSTAYYRADADVTSIQHRALVVVDGFRRIGSYPPRNVSVRSGPSCARGLSFTMMEGAYLSS
jgi:hypothetical protein